MTPEEEQKVREDAREVQYNAVKLKMEAQGKSHYQMSKEMINE